MTLGLGGVLFAVVVQERIRCLSLETLAHHFTLPCEHPGCKRMLVFAKKTQHQVRVSCVCFVSVGVGRY
jgi:hypothetical protein